MRTPADVLADRLLALDATQELEVERVWRLRGEPTTVERAADVIASAWASRSGLPPAGDEAGWRPDDEAHLLHGLDRLLLQCHPDGGGDDELPRPVTEELDRRYLRSGWWHRSERALVLPRRRTSGGQLSGGLHLSYCCSVIGDGVATLDVVRPELADDPEAERAPLGAADCAVAPLVGREALRLSFREEPSGRWSYGPVLDESAIDDEVLARILDAAEAARAVVLVLPEYACTPSVREQWKRVLRARMAGTIRWVLVGSGPTTVPDENVATLLAANGTTVVDQPKTQLFDLRPDALHEWQCPDLPVEADASTLYERATPHHQWSIVETTRGRIAIAVCESFKAQLDGTQVSTLMRAHPTLLLCPVFSQPTDRDYCWERPSSEPWGERGTAVVIANSLVVAEWQAQGAGTPLAGRVSCGAARVVSDSGKGHFWKALYVYVRPDLEQGVTDSVASVGEALAAGL